MAEALRPTPALPVLLALAVGCTADAPVPAPFPVVTVPAGSFMMGSDPSKLEFSGWNHPDEQPQHEVIISRSFELGTTEITQELYQAVAGSNPSHSRGPAQPVEKVPWLAAVAFANLLSEQHGLEPCYLIEADQVAWPEGPACEGFRLPTEAEWEYAARAGGSTPFAGSSRLEEVGWYEDNSGDRVHNVAQLAPNALGLFDMSGNVWEWTWDWYDPGTYAADAPRRDPVGPDQGRQRVRRGGSWHYNADMSRVANRRHEWPTKGTNVLGLRLARTVD